MFLRNSSPKQLQEIKKKLLITTDLHTKSLLVTGDRIHQHKEVEQKLREWEEPRLLTEVRLMANIWCTTVTH